MILSFVGLVTGVLTGLLGIGGGSIYVPTMVLAMGIQQQFAQSISISVIMLTSGLGAIHYFQKKHYIPGIFIKIAVFSITGSLIGSSLAIHINPLYLQKIFGIVLVCLSLLMFKGE